MLAASLRFIMLVGLYNFAHSGFMAIGAYLSTVFMMQLGFPFWISWIIGALAAAIVAIFFGLITLKVRGVYFFLCSFALGEVIRIVFNTYMVKIFGGPNGIIGIPSPAPVFGLAFEPGSMSFFYLVAITSLLIIFFLYVIENGYWGNVFLSLKESKDLAESIGIHIMIYKLSVLVIGAFCAGIAGGLYASYNGVITPTDFDWEITLFALVCVVLGGHEYPFGVVIGAALLTIMGEVFRDFSYFEPIIWGFCIIVILLFAPSGLLGLAAKVKPFIFNKAKVPTG